MSDLATPKLVNGLAPSTPVKVPSETEFGRAFWLESTDLGAIGEGLIRQAGTALGDVLEAEVQIGYVWRKKSATKSGAPQAASIKRAAGMLAHYSGQDFIVEVSAEHAREARLTHWQLEATIYAELCHINIETLEEGEVRLSLRPHDIEAFLPEIARYGLWRGDLSRAQNSFAQAPLFNLAGKGSNGASPHEPVKATESDESSTVAPPNTSKASRLAAAAKINAAANT